MQTVTFHGVIAPVTAIINVDFTPSAEWFIEQLNRKCTFTVRIKDSKVAVECKTEFFSHEDAVHYYTRAVDLARAMVDLIAFAKGWGLSVVINQYEMDDGTKFILHPVNPVLSALNTAYELTDLSKVAPLVLSNPALFMALNDLIQSITLPHHAVINCARAVEGLRHLVAGEGEDPKKAWPVFRNALNIDKSYLDPIASTSTKPRHGHRVRIEGNEVSRIVERTWTIMNRFLHYKLRGDMQLPVGEFPVLRG